MERICEKIKRECGVTVRTNPKVYAALADSACGSAKKYGVRSLHRAVREKFENPLAELLCTGTRNT